MKVSKRSLIVSIAVLCVCALSLTAASFAWFSASKTASVEAMTLEVKSQSDIKIAANGKAVEEGAESDWWVTTLYAKDFTTANGNLLEPQVNDLTPAATPFAGTFQEPDNRENVDIDTGDFSGTLVSAAGGWADFKVYVRTTKNDTDVAFNFSDFTLNANSPQGANNVVNALCLGAKVENVDGAVYSTSVNNQVVIPSTSLKALGDYFYAEVTFYVWVEGTHDDCINANATSLKAYDFSMSFQYAE